MDILFDNYQKDKKYKTAKKRILKMYFKSFPKVQYTNILDGEKQTVTNILRRIATRQAVKDELTFFTKYTIRGNEY